jgi:uncharacterized repeat protein (TIGR02543 family)
MKFTKKLFSLVLSICLITSITSVVAVPVEASTDGLIINEVCTDNDSGIAMVDGSHTDYIEIYNSSDSDIDISGFGVSDKVTKPLKTTIKNGTVIKAKSYILIYCDKSATASDDEILVALGLSKNGESVFFSDSNGTLIDSVTVPALVTDTTYARNSSGEWEVTTTPTPNEENIITGEIDDICSDPVFSQESGFYDDAFDLTISHDSDATVYYTTDGSIPTENSKVYEDTPLSITDASVNDNVLANFTEIFSASYDSYTPPTVKLDKGNVIRAVAIDSNGNKSNIITKSYFIGFNNKSSIYTKFPVINLSTDSDNLFSNDKGIYVKGDTYYNWLNSEDYDSSAVNLHIPANYLNTGKDWERETYFEYFSDGDLKLKQNIGIRIRGSYSRMYKTKSFNLYAKSTYEKSNFNFNFFGDKKSNFTNQDLNEFDKISLLSGSQSQFNLKYRNAMVQQLVDGRSCLTAEQTPCILFINGEYWGLYWIAERVSANTIANNFDVKEKDVLLIKNGEVEDGNEEDISIYNELKDKLYNTDFSIEENYEEICNEIDIQTFIDYICSVVFLANDDFVSNNYALWKTTTVDESNPYADGKWRFILFDNDQTMGSISSNAYDSNTFEKLMTNSNSYKVSKFFISLIKSKSFKMQFVNTFMDMANTNFERSQILSVLNEFDETYKDVVEQDYYRWNSKTKQSQVESRYNRFFENLKTFCENRGEYITSQVKDSLDLSGDMVNVNVYINNGDTVKLNTIDADNGFTGKYYTDYPITLTAKPKDGYTFMGWTIGGATVEDTMSDTITVTLSKDTNITANYEETSKLSIFGDVNGDFSVNVNDASVIQKYVANLLSLSNVQIALADVDSNGILNVKDATAIQRYCVGLINDGNNKIGTYVYKS